jgi:hypothetical protein
VIIQVAKRRPWYKRLWRYITGQRGSVAEARKRLCWVVTQDKWSGR